VRTLVEYLEARETIDDFMEGFPTVGRDKVLAFLLRRAPEPHSHPGKPV